MSWILTESRYVPSLHPWRESIMTTGNGHLSTRGSLDEDHRGRTRATFIHGLFVTPPGGTAQQTAVPDWTHVGVTVDGEPLGVDHGWIIGQQRMLDLRTGELERRLLWRGDRTPTMAVRFRRLLPLDQPELAVLDVEVRPLDGPATVAIETGIDASVGSPADRMWRPLDWQRPAEGDLHLLAASIDDRRHLTVDARLDVGTAPSPLIVEDAFHPRLRTEHLLAEGETWVLAKRVVYRMRQPAETASAEPTPATAYGDLVAGSRRAWDRRWANAAVDIDGDAEVELALRYAAFQILVAAPRDDRASVAAKFLSGFGYLGHVFWDTDVFIVPWLTTAAPDLAANHLAYRWRGLAAARRKAARYGHRGAFFPWEADDEGEECTPDQTVPHAGGPPIAVHNARHEEHITVDVAWAAWDHWRWSGDREGLRSQWAELVLDTARYWASRVEVDDDGSGHLRDVIGPDEYHGRVDDSWFTNRMVRWHLTTAADLLERLDELTGDGAPLRSDLDLSVEAALSWRDLARRLVLLDDDDGLPLEHAGFDRLPSLDLTAWTPRRTTMERLLGGEIRRTGVVKQADVVMALTLLGDDAGVPADTAAAAFDRYLAVTDHGSSLSLPVHAWFAARLGRPEQAYELLRAGIAIEHDDAMGNGHLGLHAATNGGLLLAVLRGMAGLAPGASEPTTVTNLPSHWRSLSFRVHHLGRWHDVEIGR